MPRLSDYYGDDLFEGFDELSLSDEEINILKTLQKLSHDCGYEYGVVFNSNGFSEPFTSYLEDRVTIPDELYVGAEIKLYHCHTNNTSLSRDDLSLLLKPEVKRITVVTPLGLIFSVERDNGILPDSSEFEDYIEWIAAEVNIIVSEFDGFWDWSYDKRFHEATKEEAFSIARHFEWIIEGGML